ncbi:hypothetical protein CerSpe_110330 [Prunus speciosa]
MFILRRKRKVEVATETALLPQLLWRRVLHLELLRATNGFDESNLLGTGGFDPVVYKGSAGVTLPDRPGLDLSKQPPDVRLSKELDFILTFKLKLFRFCTLISFGAGGGFNTESGIPYTIVRPCALTEEPAGANLIFDQGDNIMGKISREEVAQICVAALGSPYASGKTFEVKSVLPFSEPFTVDPQNPPPEKDYNVYFKTLKNGITGKEILE